MRAQNTSHAVMAQRHIGKDGLDDFPTPPWAMRALIEQHLSKENDLGAQSCLEPACGRGHMAQTLKEYFGRVTAADIADYGYGEVRDFVQGQGKVAPISGSHDWVITNPPFRPAEAFLFAALDTARVGVALLVHTVFIESIGRYDRIFRCQPPAYVAQFCERVAMVQGRLDPRASTATGYAWIVWTLSGTKRTELRWITPCRKSLERATDYDAYLLNGTPPLIPIRSCRVVWR